MTDAPNSVSEFDQLLFPRFPVVPKAWLPPTKFRAEIWGVSHVHRPLRIEGEVSATTRASGAQRSVCAAGAKKWVGIATEVPPKGASNAGQSLSHGCAVPAPFTHYTREPLGRGMRIAASLRSSQ